MFTQLIAHRHRENFPVASWLLPAASRADILAFYAFARGADNIADDPSRPAAARQAELLALSACFAAPEAAPLWAQPYFALVRSGRCSAAHGQALLSAFIQDTTQADYAAMEDVEDYCQRSAVPVGRTLLELMGETSAALNAADSLCIALQLLNHLQDAKEDYLQLGRCYLPRAWLEQHGATPADLRADQTSAALRAVFDQWLDRTASHLALAESLPASLTHSGLRLEAKAILAIAAQLAAKLRSGDPLAAKIGLSTLAKMSACLKGIAA